ncbi:hypothetical protein QWZ16_09040 [Vibrio ostreicida]|uniref:Uncharacterized protein n=1 Tax=Vibrio ostreicida TaxID=526588 RepID=A0ABT8BS89_9VIBR|nr:hypothetical protein [Vibrio ostreicida]MDN3609841.1 hypothetical protein [Vibrio ostreicida]
MLGSQNGSQFVFGYNHHSQCSDTSKAVETPIPKVQWQSEFGHRIRGVNEPFYDGSQ